MTIKAIIHLTRLNKPIGIFLLMWPTLWALWIAAGGVPDIHVLVVFVLGVILMRSAGCIINDIADRHVDGHVERTCQRPLVTGEASVKQALTLFIVLAGAAFGLVLTLDLATVMLAPVGLLLAVSYPYAKRYTHLPQLHLGIAFGWAIPMGYMAQTGEIKWEAWWLYAITVLWAVAYDTLYAMVDREDDLKIGVKSTAILFGRYDRGVIAVIQIIIVSGLVVTGLLQKVNTIFYLFMFIAGLQAGYQQWLIRKRERTACFKAFLSNHWFGLIVFLGVLLGYV